MDATMLQRASVNAGRTAEVRDAHLDSSRRDEKLPLAHSAMLVVLGSSGCWFLLGSVTRWILF